MKCSFFNTSAMPSSCSTEFVVYSPHLFNAYQRSCMFTCTYVCIPLYTLVFLLITFYFLRLNFTCCSASCLFLLNKNTERYPVPWMNCVDTSWRRITISSAHPSVGERCVKGLPCFGEHTASAGIGVQHSSLLDLLIVAWQFPPPSVGCPKEDLTSLRLSWPLTIATCSWLLVPKGPDDSGHYWMTMCWTALIWCLCIRSANIPVFRGPNTWFFHARHCTVTETAT